MAERQFWAVTLRWIARGILILETIGFFLIAASTWVFSEIGGSRYIIPFSSVIFIASFVICLISLWRDWFAGLLLIVASIGLGIYAINVNIFGFYGSSPLGFGLILPFAAMLFLLAWWLSRKTGS